MSHQLDFEELIRKLEHIGYDRLALVDIKHAEVIRLWNQSIIMYVGRGQSGAPYLNDKLAADHVDCFDKISRCPLIMKLPVDWDELSKHLAFLASDEGYELSNNYDYLTDNPFPYEVNDEPSV